MTTVLEGKVAVITGSGQGIGKATALLMAAQGAKVVVNDLARAGTEALADQVVAEIRTSGGEAVANYDSVASAGGGERLIQTAIENFGKIDVLVNNAGIVRDRMLWNMSDEEWDLVLKVHLYGHFYCTRAAVRFMRDAIRAGKLSNGRVINFTSGAGLNGNPGQPNYASAKMGIVGFTYSTANALQNVGITCNAIAPRAVTAMSDTIPEDRIRASAKRLGIEAVEDQDIQVLKRKVIGGEPGAISPLVAWLASDEAQHVTGQVFFIYEGFLALYPKPEPVKTVIREGAFDIASVSRAMAGIMPKPNA